MTERDHSYKAICIFALVVSLFASLSAIYVGYRVGATNGHALLVFSMNIMQLVYAIAVFIINWMLISFDYDQFIVSETLSMYSGVVSTLLSNVLAYAAVHIIYNSTSFPVVENFNKIIFWCSFPGIIISIAYLSVSYPEESVNTDAQDKILLGAYYYIRIISIAFNFIVTGATLYKIHLISSKQKTKKSLHEVALRTLAKRMVLYPIVQALGRSGFAWYEGEYGNTVTPLNYIDKAQYDAIVFTVLVTPMISVGYLMIFLFMQPEAMEHFKAMLCCRLYTPSSNSHGAGNSNKKKRFQQSGGGRGGIHGGSRGGEALQNVIGGGGGGGSSSSVQGSSVMEDSVSTFRSSQLTAATLAAHTHGYSQGQGQGRSGGGKGGGGGGDGVYESHSGRSGRGGGEEDEDYDEEDVILQESSYDTHHQRLTETLAAEELAIGSWSDSNFEEEDWNDDDLYRIISEKANAAVAIPHSSHQHYPADSALTKNVLLDHQYVLEARG